MVIGLDFEGYKEILGFWVNGTESSRFWLGVLNDLKARGVKDVFIFSVDRLSGLEKAIEAAFPRADIQRCVVHQIRNSLRYVSWKDRVEIRRVMYTTNIIESVNSKFRKATKGRRVFPTDEALLKCLYMAALELEKKWSRPIKDWPSVYIQIAILFEDRLG